MKNLLLIIMLFFVFDVAAQGLLQNEDFKTEAELVTAGGTKAQLLNDTKVYITSGSINKTLDDAITDGDIGGGGDVTTKGDIQTHDGTSGARLPVGTDGQFLIADSGETTGLKWESNNLAISTFIGSAYYSATNCEWVGTSATFTDFAVDSDCTFTNASGSSLIEPSTDIPAVTIDARTDGTYHVVFNGVIYSQSTAGNICGYTLSSSTSDENQGVMVTQGDLSENGTTLTGTFKFATTGNKTVRLLYRRISGSGECRVTGNSSSQYTSNFKVFFYPDSDSALVGTIKSSDVDDGLVNSWAQSNTSQISTEVCKITNAGTPSSGSAKCSTWIDSFTDIAAGRTTLNITSGTFSDAPVCSCLPVGNSTCALDSASTASAVSFRTKNTSGTNTDVDFEVICIGEK